MTLEDKADVVYSWLLAQHIHVLPEWTLACIEWYHEEYQGQNFSVDDLKDVVYEQWLNSDLAEIATPCLPQGLAEQQKTTVQGSYTLQINSIKDVGSSAYSQLVKLKGKENENVSVSATQATQNWFEPKPTRMLMMEVSDGHQKLQAMEYQPISTLTPEIPPGTKILIQGNIMCRLGVLTLQGRDVKVLGGEVETLVEENSQDKLLARILGTTLDDIPQSGPRRPLEGNNQITGQRGQQTGRDTSQQDTTGHPGNQNNNRQIKREANHFQPSTVGQQQTNKFQQSTHAHHNTNNFQQSTNINHGSNKFQQSLTNHHQSVNKRQDNNQPAVNQWQCSTSNQRQSSNNRQANNNSRQTDSFQKVEPRSHSGQSSHSSNNQFNGGVQDDIDDDLAGIDEEMLRELEKVENMEMESSNPKKTKFKKPQPPPEWPSDEDSDDEMMVAMIKNLEDQMKARGIGDKQNKKTKKVQAKVAKPQLTMIGGAMNSNTNICTLKSKIASEKFTKRSSGSQGSLNSFLKPKPKTEDSMQNTKPSPITLATESNNSRQRKSKLSLKDIDSTKSQFAAVKRLPPNNTSCKSSIDNSSPKPSDGFQPNQSVKINRSPTAPSKPLGVFIKAEKPSYQVACEEVSSMKSGRTSTSPVASSVTPIRPFLAASNQHSKVAVATRISKEESPELAAKRRRLRSGSGSTSGAPFTYLTSVTPSIINPQEPFTFSIRGFIITLLSGLVKEDNKWRLKVKLNDGTASLNAFLGNQVLQNLIGFSVSDMKQMRAAAANEEEKKAIETRQKRALEHCRKRLVDLCEIMTIEVIPGEMPIVINIRKVTQTDCQRLKQCLQSESSAIN